MLKNETKDEITLKLERDKKEISTKINVVTTKTNEKSLGLYIKDKLIFNKKSNHTSNLPFHWLIASFTDMIG